METMPTPWSPYLGPPWTFAHTWPFAVMIGNDRAAARNTQQRIRQEPNREWRIEDVQ